MRLALVVVLCLGSAMLFADAAGAASMIGDEVSLSHRFPTMAVGDIFDGPYSVTVAAGTGDRTALTASLDRVADYRVDAEADSIRIDFLDSVVFTAGTSFHGAVIEDIQCPDDPTWQITAVEVTSSMAAFGPSRVTFGPDWVAVNWQGLSVPNGATFDITLIPEPATASLVGLGLLALTRRRRR